MVGEFTGRREEMIREHGIGRMWIARDRHIYSYEGEKWGFDNGAFRDWVAGRPFDEGAYRVSLERALAHPSPPYLAVLPDVPGNMDATVGLSMRWLDEVGGQLPWYLTVQDGASTEDVEQFLGRIEGLFLGGTSAFKAQAGRWCAYAHRHGLRFHYGRCGTRSKVAHAIHIGADSADSAGPMWEHGRWQWLVETLSRGPEQLDLIYT